MRTDFAPVGAALREGVVWTVGAVAAAAFLLAAAILISDFWAAADAGSVVIRHSAHGDSMMDRALDVARVLLNAVDYLDVRHSRIR